MCFKEIIIFMALLLVFSCKEKAEVDICKSMFSFAEINQPNSIFREFIFDGNNQNTIFIKDVKDYMNPVYWEFDFNNQSLGKVDPFKFDQLASYSAIDSYDSLIWIGGGNSDLKLYDKTTKITKDLPVKNVSRIITKPNKVFFVSFYGFYMWNRKSKSIEKIESIPIDYIQSSNMIGDSILILDKKYTYNLNTKTAKEGIYFGDFRYNGDVYEFDIMGDFIFFKIGEQLWYIYEGKRGRMPLPYDYLNTTKIFDQKIWQKDDERLYCYDPKTTKISKYYYRLPGSPPNSMKTTSLEYMIESNTIWLFAPGRIMIVDMATQQHFTFPSQELENHISTTFDDCNIYLLYEHKLKIFSKQEFKNRCTFFDVKSFTNDLQAYKNTKDSLRFDRDTSATSVLAKLIFLKERFKNSTHVEIVEDLLGIESYAFQNIKYKFPNGYTDCYKDQTMPSDHRKKCISNLAYQYILYSNFKKVAALENEYKKYILNEGTKNDYEFSKYINASKKHIRSLDSLSKIYTSQDSLSFYATVQLKSLARNLEMHFGLESYYNGLTNFSHLYPESNLKDDAAYELLMDLEIRDDDSNEYWLRFINELENFLKQYPESEFTADVQYNIFQKWTYIEPANRKKSREAGERFIHNFKEDKRANSVKISLKNL